MNDCASFLSCLGLVMVEIICVSPGRADERDAEKALGKALHRFNHPAAQKKGEKQTLIEGAAAGDENSPEQARRLLARYPDAAFNAIVQGVRRSKDEEVRSALLNIAAKIKGDRPVALFREELKGPTLASRQAAARNLFARGNEEGVAAMIAEWKKLGSSEDLDDAYYNDKSLEKLVRFLALCDRRSAVEALAAGLDKRPIEHRRAVIDALEQRTRLGDGRPLSRPTQDLMDGLLVRCLDDEEECTGLKIVGAKDKFCFWPRVCDLAGTALAEVWKKPDLFDLFAREEACDRQRSELKNMWLKKQGKPALAPPVSRRVAALPEEKVHPLCKAVLTAKTEGERRAAVRGLEKLGLPAVPALRKFLVKAPTKHPARAELEALLVRLALIVSEVRFANNSLPPGKELRQMFERWKERPLTSTDAVGLVISACSALPQGAGGVRISVRRPGDDTGSIVRVWLTRPGRRKNLFNNWSTGQCIKVDGEGGQGSWRGLPAGNPPPLPKPENWAKFVRQLDEKVRDTRAGISFLLECRGQ